MEKIRALIVDDELNARKGLRTLLSRDPEIEVVGECSNGRQAVESIELLAPDLVFLDVQMPDKNAFEVLEELNLQNAPTLIFITAWDSYALKAFEVNALDYLLKPFSDERFFQAVERAKLQRRRQESEEFGERLLGLIKTYRFEERKKAEQIPGSTDEPLQKFFIKSGGEIHFVSVDEVEWLEADGYYTKLHTGKKSHLLRGNLGSIQAQLDPKRFARIHRSAVVNLSRVHRLKTWFRGEWLVVLLDGTELKVSRSYRRPLEALLARLR